MVREAGLQFVDRLGGDAGGEDLVQPLEAVVEPLEPATHSSTERPGFAASSTVQSPASGGSPLYDL